MSSSVMWSTDRISTRKKQDFLAKELFPLAVGNNNTRERCLMSNACFWDMVRSCMTSEPIRDLAKRLCSSLKSIRKGYTQAEQHFYQPDVSDYNTDAWNRVRLEHLEHYEDVQALCKGWTVSSLRQALQQQKRDRGESNNVAISALHPSKRSRV